MLPLLLVLAGTVTFSVAFWLYSSMEKPGFFEFAVAGLVLAVVVASFVIGIRRIKDHRKGLVLDDELSHRIKQKAAARAFSFSIYLWTLILLFMGDADLRADIPIGLGILGMGILFLGFWFYYSKKGLSNENQD